MVPASTSRKPGEASSSRRSSPAAALGFSGFPAAGFRLLEDLKANNDRDWFREHKAEYQSLVEHPMAALVHALAAEFRARRIPLFAKDRSPVMRVYRDIRFSKDKTPFKTHVAAEMRRSFSDSAIIFYLHMSPAESFFAAGAWQPEKPVLQRWRESIAAAPQKFMAIKQKLSRGGFELSRSYALSTMPRGFQAYGEQPSAPYLKLTSFVTEKRLEPADCFAPGLVQTAVAFADAVRPLLDYGWAMEDQAAQQTAGF